MRFDFLFFFLFSKQRINRAWDRHRHACIHDFDLQGVNLAKNRSVICFLSISGQGINKIQVLVVFRVDEILSDTCRCCLIISALLILVKKDITQI